MNKTQKVFFGITIGLLLGLILILIPIHIMSKYYICLGLIIIVSFIYDGAITFKKPINKLKYNWDDITHLKWVYNRMKHVHNENSNCDYMIRLKNIIEKLEDNEL